MLVKTSASVVGAGCAPHGVHVHSISPQVPGPAYDVPSLAVGGEGKAELLQTTQLLWHQLCQCLIQCSCVQIVHLNLELNLSRQQQQHAWHLPYPRGESRGE
jgi:hypothetical protein